jgi:tripartite ATP-independent transporter DctP family solute receptor
MMMLKKSRCLILAMVLILVVVSCNAFAAVKKPITLIYGNIFGTNHFFYKGDVYFKELVEKNSKGQIQVKLYPAAQLGPQTEQIQATMVGSQQMTMTSGGVLAPYWKKLSTLDLPYVYRDQEHYIKVAEKITSIIDAKEMAAKTGMRILSARIRTPRQLTTKFPVNKLEDIKGLKMRVPELPVMVALWKALGAVPTVIPSAEIYTSLATGTVDAQENPFADIYAAKTYEQTKYCALTSHMREIIVMLINNNFWNKLTTSQKKLIQNAAVQSSKLMIKTALEGEEADYQALLKVGMIFTKPNLAPFREKAKTVWDQFGDKELIEKIQAVR